MTAPSLGPTEAMRGKAMRLLRSVRYPPYWDRLDPSDALVAYFARALLEQDTAARREGHTAGFAEAREMARLAAHGTSDHAECGHGEGYMDGRLDAAAAVGLITPPEPPSEKP